MIFASSVFRKKNIPRLRSTLDPRKSLIKPFSSENNSQKDAPNSRSANLVFENSDYRHSTEELIRLATRQRPLCAATRNQPNSKMISLSSIFFALYETASRVKYQTRNEYAMKIDNKLNFAIFYATNFDK